MNCLLKGGSGSERKEAEERGDVAERREAAYEQLVAHAKVMAQMLGVPGGGDRDQKHHDLGIMLSFLKEGVRFAVASAQAHGTCRGTRGPPRSLPPLAEIPSLRCASWLTLSHPPPPPAHARSSSPRAGGVPGVSQGARAVPRPLESLLRRQGQAAGALGGARR